MPPRLARDEGRRARRGPRRRPCVSLPGGARARPGGRRHRGRRPSFCPTRERMLVLAGDRAAALDLPKADELLPPGARPLRGRRRGAGAVAAQGGAHRAGLSASQAEEDAARAVDLYLSARTTSSAPPKRCSTSARYAVSEAATPRPREHFEHAQRAGGAPSARTRGPCSCLARQAAQLMMAGRSSECVATSDRGDRAGGRARRGGCGRSRVAPVPRKRASQSSAISAASTTSGNPPSTACRRRKNRQDGDRLSQLGRSDVAQESVRRQSLALPSRHRRSTSRVGCGVR